MATRHAIGTTAAARTRGVTLIEALVVVVVLAVVASTAAPGFRGWLDERRLRGAAGQLAADLQLARVEAVARNRVVSLSWHASGAASCWVLHTGAAADCACGGSGPALCSGSAAEIRTARFDAAADRVRVDGNVASIAFDPLHGTSTPAGTLRVLGPDGRAVHHVVNVMGRARTCSPGAAVAGHRAC